MKREGFFVMAAMLAASQRLGNLIAFTPEGQAFADEVIGEMRKIELRAFERMTPGERDTVENGLHILAKSLREVFSE